MCLPRKAVCFAYKILWFPIEIVCLPIENSVLPVSLIHYKSMITVTIIVCFQGLWWILLSSDSSSRSDPCCRLELISVSCWKYSPVPKPGEIVSHWLKLNRVATVWGIQNVFGIFGTLPTEFLVAIWALLLDTYDIFILLHYIHWPWVI